MGKLKQKLSQALKSGKTKKIEEKVRHCLEKAEELFEAKPEYGERYLVIADENYGKLTKENEELRQTLAYIANKYING